MPGAHTHDAITVVTGLTLAPIAYPALVGMGVPNDAVMRGTAILVGAHLLSGIMFSPDLDLDSAIDDRWGIFFWIWRPYMWLVPHRSRLFSHGLLIAPLLRLLYFFLMVVLLLIASAWLLGLMYDHPRETQAFLAGFITGSAAHSIADWLVTGGKRYLHRTGFRVTHHYADPDGWQPRRHRPRSWID